MSVGLWIGAATTLAGAFLGGVIIYVLSRQHEPLGVQCDRFLKDDWTRLTSRLSQLCGGVFCVFPGQAEDADFFICQPVRVRWVNSRGGDEHTAELGGYAGGGRLGLALVPGGAEATGVDTGG
jgi:hypothetical protein